jgi:hypothetical protein
MPETNTTTPPTAVVTLLSRKSIHDALLGKVNAEKFSARHTYVGGSEVGGCAREVAWKKVDPSRARIGDPWAAGRILAGQILENAIVQLVRSAFDGAVRATGFAQDELSHPSAPLRCHPDGKLSWKVEWVDGMQIAYVDENGVECFLDRPLEGHGSMEIKTCSSYIFRKYTKTGLPIRYKDQTTVEMGLGGTTWTLLVLVNRENIAEFSTFLLHYSEDGFEKCVARSHFIMGSVQRISEATGPEEMLLDEAEAQFLPEPEPERGWCAYCDHAACPEKNKVVEFKVDKAFPEDVALEVEVKAEEYIALKPDADRCDKLKDQLKDRFLEFGIEAAYGLYVSKSAGRKTVDSKALEAEKPEIYQAFLKQGADSYSLKIGVKKASKSPKKGEA